MVIGKLELDIVVDIEFNAPEQMYMSLRLKRRRREVQELVARVDDEIDNRYGQEEEAWGGKGVKGGEDINRK